MPFFYGNANFFHLHMMQKNYIHTNYINKSATSRQVALTNNYQCVFMGGNYNHLINIYYV